MQAAACIEERIDAALERGGEHFPHDSAEKDWHTLALASIRRENEWREWAESHFESLDAPRAASSDQLRARLDQTLADAEQQVDVLRPGGRYAWKSRHDHLLRILRDIVNAWEGADWCAEATTAIREIDGAAS